jgi:hypothetical protein
MAPLSILGTQWIGWQYLNLFTNFGYTNGHMIFNWELAV